MPLDGVVRGLWRDAVVETDPQGRTRVNRITYEICVLEALRERLRCKEIWVVVGASRCRNPDEDLPADFGARRAPTTTRSTCLWTRTGSSPGCGPP